jgi:hypothetical protein
MDPGNGLAHLREEPLTSNWIFDQLGPGGPRRRTRTPE